ncbi:MAG TPA: sigma 54-interacting transcriptional regulator [Candidatus Aquilonibacter sp.]|nr:sigma 54-interacting transcriptional regulator [Candidatus Aquilonibacter sp.]
MSSKIEELTIDMTASPAPAKSGKSLFGWTSPAMLSLENVVSEIARTNIPILLAGEVGTGKRTFARHIHARSQQCDKPLLKISCAALKPEAFEAEIGLGAPRHGDETPSLCGTVLFDEISELDPACQRSLLYALPDGDTKNHPNMISARVISTTNKNLDAEMRAGRFRTELYYRISGVCLRLPPLRERKEDITLLTDIFLAKYAAEFDRPAWKLSAATMEMFRGHSWPGNIRELENTVKKIAALGDEGFALAGFATTANEPPAESGPAPTANSSLKAAARAASREAERELILKALARTRWNRKRAAQELQISYKSLLYKLKQIGVPETGVS